MDARCQMQERGERERRVMSRGHRHQMPQHTTLWLMATGRREKLIKTGFQTLTDDNIFVALIPSKAFDVLDSIQC